MRYRKRMSSLALLIEPTSHARHQILDRFAFMRSSRRIGQPRHHVVRFMQLHITKFKPGPAAIVTVAQSSRRGRRQPQCLSRLPRSQLRPREDLLRPRCDPSARSDLRTGSLTQLFIKRKCSPSLSSSRRMANKSESRSWSVSFQGLPEQDYHSRLTQNLDTASGDAYAQKSS